MLPLEVVPSLRRLCGITPLPSFPCGGVFSIRRYCSAAKVMFSFTNAFSASGVWAEAITPDMQRATIIFTLLFILLNLLISYPYFLLPTWILIAKFRITFKLNCRYRPQIIPFNKDTSINIISSNIIIFKIQFIHCKPPPL